jgi:hypothetical protein
VQRLVKLLRERRRRRLKASGEPLLEDWPCKAIRDQDWLISVADILRTGRRRTTEGPLEFRYHGINASRPAADVPVETLPLPDADYCAARTRKA